jgi:DNA polymerase I-like protein with 3'-5' exonuclease and polymerase domains
MYLLVNSDLKTIEPVVNAWISNCQKAKDVFWLGCLEPKNPYGDWYRAIGSVAFEKTPDKITKEERNVAKGDIVLAVNYGRAPEILAPVLGWSVEKTEQFYFKFFYEDYPELHMSLEAIRYNVFNNLPVTTCCGTTQYFSLRNVYDYDRQKHYWMLPHQLKKELKITTADQHILDKAGNFRIQGPSAMINNCGGVELQKRRRLDLDFRTLVIPHITCHDAWLMSIKEDRLQEGINKVAGITYDYRMLEARGFQFGFTEEVNPLRGEFKVGLNYYDMEETNYERTIF